MARPEWVDESVKAYVCDTGDMILIYCLAERFPVIGVCVPPSVARNVADDSEMLYADEHDRRVATMGQKQCLDYMARHDTDACAWADGRVTLKSIDPYFERMDDVAFPERSL